MEVREVRDFEVYVLGSVCNCELPIAMMLHRSAASHSNAPNSARHPGRRPSVKFRQPLMSSFLRLVHLRTWRGNSVNQSLCDKSKYVRLSRGSNVVSV